MIQPFPVTFWSGRDGKPPYYRVVFLDSEDAAVGEGNVVVEMVPPNEIWVHANAEALSASEIEAILANMDRLVAEEEAVAGVGHVMVEMVPPSEIWVHANAASLSQSEMQSNRNDSSGAVDLQVGVGGAGRVIVEMLPPMDTYVHGNAAASSQQDMVRVVSNHPDLPTLHSVSPEQSGNEGRANFGTGVHTRSIQVRVGINGSTPGQYQIINLTPGTSGSTAWVSAQPFSNIRIELYPWSGTNLQGVPGPMQAVDIFIDPF